MWLGLLRFLGLLWGCCGRYCTKLLLLVSFCCVQPLILPNVVPHSWYFQYLITTFYAPVFLLATVWKGELTGHAVRKEGNHAIFAYLFVGVAKQVIRLHREHGMSFPMCYQLEKAAPALYRLLVTESDGQKDVALYSVARWGHKVSARSRSASSCVGWSNFPMVLWVVAFLVQEKVLRVDPTIWKSLKSGVNPLPSLDDFEVSFCDDFTTGTAGAGSAEGGHAQQQTISLSSTINFLLYKLFLPEHARFCLEVQGKVQHLTKDYFYHNLPFFFQKDGHFLSLIHI